MQLAASAPTNASANPDTQNGRTVHSLPLHSALASSALCTHFLCTVQPKMSYKDGYQKAYFVLDSFEDAEQKIKALAQSIR